MNLEVTVSRDYLSPVLADLAQRRGNIQEVQSRQDNKVVIGYVPLAEIMVGTLWLNLHSLHKLLENPRDSIRTGVDVWGRAFQSSTKFELCSTKCVVSLNDRFSMPSTYLLPLLLAQPVLPVILFPAASPALGQASKCQQSLYPTLGLRNASEAYPRSWFSVLHGTYQIFPDNGQKMCRERFEA